MGIPAVELRVLGALMEKERTTPDGYPLSAQALLTACNQKTSRDPVTDYHLQDVLAAVTRLRDRGLLTIVSAAGERVPKHHHRAAEAFGLDRAEAAVLTVLILRGAQTPGELRTRTERFQTFADPASVEAVLERLASRSVPLVRNLGRSPGQSQDRWDHLLGLDEERLKPRVRSPENGPREAVGTRTIGGGTGAAESAPVGEKPPGSDDLAARLVALERRVAELEAALAAAGIAAADSD